MSEQADLINEFRSIADVPEERARFFLESAAWQLPVALSSFFDAGPSPDIPDEMMDAENNPSEEEDPPDEDAPARNTRASGSQPDKKPETTRSTRSSKFSSIRDFAKEEKLEDDEEEGQEYYAGGSEQSGEVIVGPPRKKKTNEEITKDLFAEAKKHGAESVEPGDRGPSKPKAKYFTGGGYKLGESEEDASEFVPGAETPEERGPTNVVLKLWANGFTVDDGPIRDFNDPANAEFLKSIKKGEIPQELLKGARRGEVHVDMEDHRQEEYKAQKKKIKPFSGQGHMLGSPTPAVSYGASAVVPQVSPVDPPVIVRDSEPTTNIQIRLAGGQRLVQKFNHNHRISDIRSFLINKNPQMAGQTFVLMTTFPNKELTDETQTISDAKLLNASIVQKLK
uniref:NSFL1 cofactor p47-like n=1 Tax=Phallusia mammillata TaxID=59560 RepID=A0A6F9DN75_9ASCI|nr:NSFL1 cofactor p47-like [Phallusia mammillata]